MPPELLWTGPEDGPVLVLAHGAGAPMDTPWMDDVAGLLADRRIRVARFEFAYMASRRDGVRKPPPKAERVMEEYRNAVAAVLEATIAPVVIGGKSMGGRVASMIADELHGRGEVAGLVCLGYPFHPPGDPAKTRIAHLEHLATPTLICQGTRDPFGTRDEVPGYALSDSIRLLWLEDGEHGFVPRVKVSGFTVAQHLAMVADGVAAFVRSALPGKAPP